MEEATLPPDTWPKGPVAVRMDTQDHVLAPDFTSYENTWAPAPFEDWKTSVMLF